MSDKRKAEKDLFQSPFTKRHHTQLFMMTEIEIEIEKVKNNDQNAQTYAIKKLKKKDK